MCICFFFFTNTYDYFRIVRGTEGKIYMITDREMQVGKKPFIFDMMRGKTMNVACINFNALPFLYGSKNRNNTHKPERLQLNPAKARDIYLLANRFELDTSKDGLYPKPDNIEETTSYEPPKESMIWNDFVQEPYLHVSIADGLQAITHQYHDLNNDENLKNIVEQNINQDITAFIDTADVRSRIPQI